MPPSPGSALAHAATGSELAASIVRHTASPLTSLTLWARSAQQWLEGEEAAIGHARECLKQVERQAGKLGELLQVLTEWTGPARKPAIFCMAATLHSLLDELERQLPGQAPDWARVLGDRPAWVWGDELQLRCVMQRLLLQAIERLGQGPGRQQVLVELRRDDQTTRMNVRLDHWIAGPQQLTAAAQAIEQQWCQAVLALHGGYLQQDVAGTAGLPEVVMRSHLGHA